MLRFLVILLGLFVLGYVLVSGAYVAYRVSVGRQLAAGAVPFARELPAPRLRFLMAGDSTAVGAGASEARYSIAGRLAEDFPDAAVQNSGQRGFRARDVAQRLSRTEGVYDLVLVHAGGNDIIRFTSLEKLRASVTNILREAKRLSPNVLILHSGNMGLAPFFPWPFSLAATWRTEQVRAIYQELATQYGAHYVDLYTTKKDDPFRENPDQYYAADGLHLTDMGYSVWYGKIRGTMDSAGIAL